MYEIPDSGTTNQKFGPICQWQSLAMSQKDNQAEVLSVHSLQVESILPVAHNEEKVKTTSFMFLMFLCQK